MNSLLPRRPLRGRRSAGGSALLIVLAMIVLLTGLIVAFLFRTGSSVFIAGNSANTTRADLFGQGAIDTTIGDLQTEISAGSVSPPATYGTSPNPVYTVYTPLAATNMIAQVALPSGVTTTAFPNLVKMSTPGVPFSAGDPSNGGQGRAAGKANGAGTTTTASLNGHLVSLSSWNKPLLLPKASPADTYNLAPTGFIAPNWILVARNGSNPTAWNPNLEAIPAHASDPTNPVVGRYAYTIYNEGGLLDANVAGSPAASSGASVSYSSTASYKNALAYADLTQLQDSSGNQLLTSTDINALVGWRNYASAKAGGQFPSYTLPSQSGTTPTAFDLATLFNSTGFLRTSNSTALSASGNQSDHMFMSRQQLISFLAAADPNLANMQNVMQYLGTFSRGLSQPAYVSPTSLSASAPTVQSNTTDSSSGANDASSDGADKVINPAFLTVRAQSAFIRNDGSTAVVNEPLVKKRFALSRLAWLTYNGPSANRPQFAVGAASPGAGNANYDMWALVNQYGVSPSFLAQGTPQNIFHYFGLSWVSDPNNSGASEWVYSHAGTSPLSSSGSASSARISILSKIAGREPDFFELLKAGICVGSIGKAYADSATVSAGSIPAEIEVKRDRSVDGAILQIGANIISQSQPSGYPTRILGNSSIFGVLQEYRGDEDLPYIYQVREAKIRTVNSGPSYTTLPVTGTRTAAGTAVELQEPEIWNPHAWRSASADANPRPTNFRIIAVTNDPNHLYSSTSGSPTPISLQATWRGAVSTWADSESGSPSSPLKLTAASTSPNDILTFSIPITDSYLFREPTLLIEPSVPAGSSLNGTTITSLDTPTLNIPHGPYLGINIGTIPLAFPEITSAADTAPATGASTTPTPYVLPTESATTVGTPAVTYLLQYQSGGNYITYDAKYTPVLCASNYDSWGGTANGFGYTFADTKPTGGTLVNEQVGTEIMAACFDPRTSRFGMMEGGATGMQHDVGNRSVDFAPATNAYTWLSLAQCALWSMRPDENQGFTLTNQQSESKSPIMGAGAFGWYTYGGSVGGYTKGVIRPGLSAQNNPAMSSTSDTSRYAGDTSTTPPATPYGNGCFADPDNVIRRGMAAYVPPGSPQPSSTTPGGSEASSIPLKPAYTVGSSSITPLPEAASRPVMLNRPFRSVAELGYVFSDTPWRNLDFSTPESGNVALLDLFCINDTDDPNGLLAGKVDLNTKQTPVLQAILAGAYEDEFSASAATSSSATSTTSNPVIGVGGASPLATAIAKGLVKRTSLASTPGGPLENISELVGKWNSSVSAGSSIDGGQSYTGFSGTNATTSTPPSSPPNLSSILSQESSVSGYGYNEQYVQRYRTATIRALSSAGQVRVWNLMIDLVAQTGRYPASATNLDQFIVEGQQRYWVHLAIDRLTGKVIDKQVEVVNE